MKKIKIIKMTQMIKNKKKIKNIPKNMKIK